MKFKAGLALFLLIIVQIQANQIIDLSSWGGNFSAASPSPFDSFGYAIATGDVNGDGMEDIVAGAYYSDPFQQNAAGTVFIFFGTDYPSQQVDIDLSEENADIQIYGASSNDQCGKAIAVGNINNDAFDDIIIASPFADVDAMESAGKVYVIYGGNNLQSEYFLQNQDHNSIIKGGNANDFIGVSLKAADLNNDNFADLIIGSPNADHPGAVNCGKTFIIFGSNSLNQEYDLSQDEQDLTIIGENMNDNSASCLQVGNINNDQYNDLFIGAPQADPDGRNNAGKIYLIKGVENFTGSEILLSGSPDLTSTILGASIEGKTGNTIALGDINGDNNDDLICSDLSGNNFNGAVEIIFGNVTLPQIIDLNSGASDVTIVGAESGGRLGEKVYSSRINSDGIDDIIIGIPEANTVNGNGSGILYIIYGNSFIADINISSEPPEITVLGASPNDKLGTTFQGLFFNSDNVMDFCIGAPEAGNNTGKFFTIYGDIPYLWAANPHNGQSDVEINASVSFFLSDLINGIDLNSINVNIGGTQYNSSSPEFSYTGTSNEYNITINPSEDFDYSQIVDIRVNCTDLAGWIMPEVSYAFLTMQDSDAPYTDLWNPEPDEMDVSIDTDVTFHIYDNGQGIDVYSIEIEVDGITYIHPDFGSPSFSYSGDSNDYLISISPENPFFYNQLVGVMIEAADLADSPNVMTPFTYSFTCGSDLIPPYTVLWDPTFNEEISKNEPIQVLVADDETGVNINSIEFYLDENDITDLSEISPISNGFRIFYQPEEIDYYSYGEHVMRLVCGDNAIAPNTLDEASTFICIEDSLAPYTSNHYPEKYAENIATNTHFSVDIMDDIMGVDQDSISIKINDTEIMGTSDVSIVPISNGFNIF